MEPAPHILVVDDDREIRDLLPRLLRKHGFRVTGAADGREMRKVLGAAPRIDLVVLDLMLPGEDGLSLCRWLRANSRIPVIMLTAMGEDTDRIIGLEMGADDHMPKPFNLRELVARVRAVLRRASAPPAPEGADGGPLRFGGGRLDPARRELHHPDGALVPLTSGEFDLLVALAERPNRVLNCDQLLDLTKGRDAVPFDRSVDVQISRLRRKLEDDPKMEEEHADDLASMLEGLGIRAGGSRRSAGAGKRAAVKRAAGTDAKMKRATARKTKK